jgi:hypothetical protein
VIVNRRAGGQKALVTPPGRAEDARLTFGGRRAAAHTTGVVIGGLNRQGRTLPVRHTPSGYAAEYG